MIYFIIPIAIYLWMAIVYSKLGKRFEVRNSWLSWIPYGQFYVSISLAEVSLIEMLIPFGLVAFVLTYTEFLPILVALCALLIWMYTLERRILSRFGKNPNLAILHFVPLGSFVILIIYSIEAFCGKNDYFITEM